VVDAPQSQAYGVLADGSTVERVSLRNAGGIELDAISYGGAITRLSVPDLRGVPGNIVLGLDSLDDYVASRAYFGALIGRCANRIAAGRLTLDGATHQLSVNDGENHLHGGACGFDKKNWKVSTFTKAGSTGVQLTLASPDGDQGYPGNLHVQATYELSDDGWLDVRLRAVTDKPTIVNLTQHSYFNLAGGGDVLDHELTINAGRFTPVNRDLIPTGELREVGGTPFDFRTGKAVGADIDAADEQLQIGRGYDHNFVLKDEDDGEPALAARLYDRHSGRKMEVWTTAPGLQLYSGNYLDGRLYRGGLCLEPQYFPDSPNQPRFLPAILRPGNVYETRIAYRFSASG